MSLNVRKCNKNKMPNVLNAMNYYKMECRCHIHEMLWNAEAKTTDFYKMVYSFNPNPLTTKFWTRPN